MMNHTPSPALRFNVVYVWPAEPNRPRLGVYVATSREALLRRFAEDGAVVRSATRAS